MFSVRIHGRGGQGVVTAAELLSVAAFREGRHAQAFPSFGSERMGAPVVAFCRLSDQPIRLREPVMHPDAVVILDATLLNAVPVFDGLDDAGLVLVNSSHAPEELGLGELAERLPAGHLRTVPATALALEHLGKPRPNLVMLGALAAHAGIVSLPSLVAAIGDRFRPDVAARNAAAATAAHALVAGTVAGGAPSIADEASHAHAG